MAYAKGTKTTIDTTEQQIKAMLRKMGADSILFAEQPNMATVMFHLRGRALTFRLPLPGKESFRRTPQKGLVRSEDAAAQAWVQACRERWRGLHLCIKAKLESVDQKIESFDEAFLSHITMPGGDTVGDRVLPEMQAMLEGQPPRPLLSRGSASHTTEEI